ncbi:MAG: hypothetical protein U5K84_06730 [Alkalibacterium sp.]|nr:hypothetical protein [Alkalibacterium sp.]
MGKIKTARGVIYFFLILLVIICFIPFYMMIINATRSNSEILRGFTLIPGDALMDNYEILDSYINIWIGFRNSLIIALSVTILNSYFSALTAFALVVYQIQSEKLHLHHVYRHDDGSGSTGPDRIV